MQPADEYECREIFTTFENLGKLALEVANIRQVLVIFLPPCERLTE